MSIKGPSSHYPLPTSHFYTQLSEIVVHLNFTNVFCLFLLKCCQALRTKILPDRDEILKLSGDSEELALANNVAVVCQNNFLLIEFSNVKILKQNSGNVLNYSVAIKIQANLSEELFFFSF